MKKYLVFASSMLLATAMSVAQDNTSGQAGAMPGQEGMSGDSSHTSLRGCLSGSNDNYTLTDSNGTIYHLLGANDKLGPAVGHEVQLTGASPLNQDARPTNDNQNAAPNSIQVANVTDTNSPCKTGVGSASGSGSSATAGTGDESTPVSSKPPIDDKSPRGSQDEAAPPHPQMMAMLQEPGTPAAKDSTSSSSMSSTTTSTSQASQSVDSANQSSPNNSTDTVTGKTGSHGTEVPMSSTNSTGQNTPPAETTNGAAGTSAGATGTPVTSQTPANSTSPTSPNSQLGTPSPNTTGQTPGQANSNAAGASQGELSTNPQTGQTTGRGVDNQGVNNPTASPNTPAANANDANKPLYERQATDVPWANRSGTNANSNTTNSTTPQSNPQ